VLSGVFDIQADRAAAAAAEFECPRFVSLEQMAAEADAAIVAVPTTAHCEVGLELMARGLHVLVEKPIAASIEEADRLTRAAREYGRVLQVGHLERFNPAVAALRSVLTVPLFFEVHRLSVFTPRSLDVDVVADLMIHDLDIVLALTGSFPEEIRAAGIRILSPQVDIANVRLSFPGGIIANLTASRVSTERVRKLRLFQPGQYVSIDYARQDCVVIGVDTATRQVQVTPRPVQQAEPLALQFSHFLACLAGEHQPEVDGAAATRALEAARLILDKIEEHAAVVSRTLRR
jgi:predicted dehydrogenase